MSREQFNLAKSRQNHDCKSVLCQIQIHELPNDTSDYYQVKVKVPVTIRHLSRPKKRSDVYLTEWCKNSENVLAMEISSETPFKLLTPHSHAKHKYNTTMFEWTTMLSSDVYNPVGKLTLLIDETQRYHSIQSLFATLPRFILQDLWAIVLEFQL